MVIAGYDIGSRIAQALARTTPRLVRALVIAPPLPGVGQRVPGEHPPREFWYQPFHRLELSERLIDGNPDAVRAYLRHFWTHWSGPGFELDDADLDRLVDLYSGRGAFTASIGWYRGGAGAIASSLCRDGSCARGPDRPAHARALARPRPALPTRVVGPARRVLRRCDPQLDAGGRALLAAGGAGRVRRGDPRGVRQRLSQRNSQPPDAALLKSLAPPPMQVRWPEPSQESSSLSGAPPS